MSREISNDEKKTKTSDLITQNVSEAEAIGFNAKYYSSTHKEYMVSRGKTRIFRRSVFLILLGMVISILSLKLLPDQLEGNLAWLSPMLWFPRLAAFLFIYLAVMRLREVKKINPIISFSKEGIRYEENLITWESVKTAEYQYDLSQENVNKLLIHTDKGIIEMDISEVDEFSEDVAVVLHKYLKKYKR